MLLITGGTGFIGRSVLRQLAGEDAPVRTLLRPSSRSPRLPAGVTTDVALAALSDRRGLRAALVGIESIIHLAGAERSGRAADLEAVDVEGTRNLVEAAADAGVRRLVFVSRLGSDRSSAYPVLRAKALAEESIRRSGVPATILRAAMTYGPGDAFTMRLARLLAVSPGVFPMPGDGSVVLQPLWVEDLATAILWALQDEAMIGRTIDLGGPEYLALVDILRLVMQASGHPRILVPVPPPYLRAGAWVAERILPSPPVTTLWLDHLAVNRMAELGAMPRAFGLQPARLETRLEYLKAGNRRKGLARRGLRRRPESGA